MASEFMTICCERFYFVPRYHLSGRTPPLPRLLTLFAHFGVSVVNHFECFIVLFIFEQRTRIVVKLYCAFDPRKTNRRSAFEKIRPVGRFGSRFPDDLV